MSRLLTAGDEVEVLCVSKTFVPQMNPNYFSHILVKGGLVVGLRYGENEEMEKRKGSG